VRSSAPVRDRLGAEWLELQLAVEYRIIGAARCRGPRLR
jgi:hypothetical protein